MRERTNAVCTHKLSASGPEGSPSGSYPWSLTMHCPSMYSLRCGLYSGCFQRWLFSNNCMRLPCPGWCCSTGRSSWGSWHSMQVSWHYTSLHWDAFPRSRSSSAMLPCLPAPVSGLWWYWWHGRPGNRLQTGNTWFQGQGQMAGHWLKCRKRKGPRTVPCKMPEMTLAMVEWQPLTTTLCMRSPRTVSNHFNDGPCIPYSRSLLSSLPWGTLLKALLKSNTTISVWCPLSL